MTTDFTTYQPPGVFVEEDPTTLVTVVGLTPTVVALVGPAQGYRLGAETIVLVGSAPVPLTPQGIQIDSNLVVAKADGTPYSVTTDYLVDEDEDDPTLTTITRVDGGDIIDGEAVYVSFRYTDPDYYAPLRVSDMDDVQDAFGPAVDLATGEVMSPLSFGAKIAFDNGARQLVLVATQGNIPATGFGVSKADFVNAYEKLEAIFDVSIVVPLSVGVTGTAAAPGDTYGVGQDLQLHCEQMAEDNVFRVGVVGFEKDATILPVEAASNMSSKRIIMAWPQVLRYYHGALNVTHDVAGYYLAAAYAGRMASLPVQMPLTRKQVASFMGFPAGVLQSMTNANKNEWSAGGVTVTELNQQNRMIVRHGTTTDRSNTYSREISLVRAKDALVQLIQQTVEAAELIGSWIDGDTVGQVKGVVAGALEAAVGSELIVAYNDLKGRQLTTDPSVIEIKFQYKPAYPLNYIVISFSINTETGETAVVEGA